VLAFMTFPKAHRTRIQSTNPRERLDAETKRRYLSLEALRTLSDDQPARLSAVVS
jgi:putative transposase